MRCDFVKNVGVSLDVSFFDILYCHNSSETVAAQDLVYEYFETGLAILKKVKCEAMDLKS